MTVKEIKEKMGSLHNKATALTALAKSEQRDLTDAETAEFDGHMKNYKALETESLPRAQWLDNKEAELAQNRVTAPQAGGDGAALDDYPNAPRAHKILLPAQARYRVGSLKAFTGPNAEKEAYVAGRLILATIFKHEPSAKWCQENGIDIRNALQGGANELGGVLVTDEMETAIINLREVYGVFRRESNVRPMGSDTQNVPRRTGGVTAYFVGEGGGITDSDKAWDNVKLIAKKLAVLVKYSTEINEDAVISIGDDLTNEIAYAFSKKEDECGFIGDGTSTYGGIVGVVNAVAAGSVVTAVTTHTGFETLTMADFESCIGKLPVYAEANAKWYVSKVGYAASMQRLLDAAGGNTNATLSNGTLVREFLGFPVVISQVLNSTLGADASKPKAILGDLRMGTTMGDRRGMSIAVSADRYFENDQLAIRGTQRFDINCHDTGTASTAGSLIVLNSAAS